MKAVIIKKPGGSEQLIVDTHTKPVPKNDEILINVKATAVNRTDIIHRESKQRYFDFPILGVEVAGIVEQIGENANIKVGTRVMGLVNGGGYAQYVTMPMNRAMIIPDNLSFVEAAAIPEVFLTAYQTLFWHGQLKEKETVLIHAGGSGVGTAAIQLAKQLKQAKVLTTAGSRVKLDYVSNLGADICISYKEQQFDSEVLKATNNKGANVILDFVGASYWEKNLNSIAVDGRWILIGLLGGSNIDNFNMWELMDKRIQLIGTLLTPRSDAYKSKLTKEFVDTVMPLFKDKKIKPIIDSTFMLEEVQNAHRHMQNNANIGKIILRVN